MMTTTHINDEYLGADTKLSPEVIDFLNASHSKSETKEKKPQTRQIHGITLDEYELAMTA